MQQLLNNSNMKINTKGKNIWQIAAGNGKDKNYAKLCLQQDVVLFGPGRYGAWPDCEKPMLEDQLDRWTVRKARAIGRFAEEIKPGDIVVLRVGAQYAYGVGEVVGDYGYSERFGKVQEPEPWDLQHFRRVRWLWHQDGEPQVFPVYALKIGNTVQKLIPAEARREVRDWLEALDIPEAAFSRPLQKL